MGANLANLPQIREALEGMAYTTELEGDALIVKVGKFPVVLTINEDQKLTINCQITKTGDIPEANLPRFALMALDANTRLNPYAVAMITDLDDPSRAGHEDQWPIVLTDMIPLGDFEESELRSAFLDLEAALVASREVLQAAFDESPVAS